MIVGKIAGAVLKLILPDVTEHLLRAFKLEKLADVFDYMDKPNDCDKRVDKLEKLVGEKFEEIEMNNKILMSFMKQIKNKKMFKKMEAKLK